MTELLPDERDFLVVAQDEEVSRHLVKEIAVKGFSAAALKVLFSGIDGVNTRYYKNLCQIMFAMIPDPNDWRDEALTAIRENSSALIKIQGATSTFLTFLQEKDKKEEERDRRRNALFSMPVCSPS